MWRGLGRHGSSRGGVEDVLSLSLPLSHLDGTAKWWSNLSDLWLGAGPDVIACHSGTEWEEVGGGALQKIQSVPIFPISLVFLHLLFMCLLAWLAFRAAAYHIVVCSSHVSPQKNPNKRKIALIFKWWYYIKRGDLIYQNARTTPLLYVLHLNGIAGCQGHGGN